MATSTSTHVSGTSSSSSDPISLTPLLSDKHHYNRTITALKSNTDRFEKVREYCITTLATIMYDRTSASKGNVNTIFRYLGVGSGQGDPDVTLLCELAKKFERIEVTIVEPSAEMLEIFKNRVAEIKDSLANVCFNWINVALEDFMQRGGEDQFHGILVSGVMGYFNDKETVLRFLYGLLDDDGTLTIINDAEAGWFYSFYDPVRFPGLGVSCISGSDIVSHLKRINARTITSHVIETTIYVTSCFQEDSVEGNLLLDLLTHCVDFRKSAPPSLLDEVLAYMSTSDLTRQTEGRLGVNNDRDVIIVQKK